MSASVKYINEFTNEISLEQAKQASLYFKIYLEDDEPSKKEQFVNGVLQNTIHIIYSLLEIDIILPGNPNSSFEYIYNQSSCRIIELRGYNHGRLNSKQINVFNENGGLICHKYYELSDNILSLQITEKFYFDEHNIEKYEFIYNQDGSCFKVYDLQLDQADFYAWSIDADPDVSFTWNSFGYYRNAEPLIP